MVLTKIDVLIRISATAPCMVDADDAYRCIERVDPRISTWPPSYFNKMTRRIVIDTQDPITI